MYNICHLVDLLKYIILHTKTIHILLSYILRLFKFCLDQNRLLHPDKCSPYSRSIGWCGRLISADYVRYDSHQMYCLIKIYRLFNGSNLRQFLSSLQWVIDSIQNFSLIFEPLQMLTELIRQSARSQRKLTVCQPDIPYSC